MANNRNNICSSLKTLLVGETDAGSNVFVNRFQRLGRNELPAIIIYTSQEGASPESLQGRRYRRSLELQIEVKVAASDNADQDLNDILSAVEGVLVQNQGISGTVLSSTQTNTEMRIGIEGEQDIASGILTFECLYIA